MAGDFSRFTFDAKKHYSAVQMQQGRVQVDADWNEQLSIDKHRLAVQMTDFIGYTGVPDGVSEGENNNFKIKISEQTEYKKNIYEIEIREGRIYVAGEVYENEEDVNFTQQPDYPCKLNESESSYSCLPKKPGTYIAYLDVWPREITALEDPNIREVALGGPDTTTRIKNLWQVKLTPKPDEPDKSDGNKNERWHPKGVEPISTGQMKAEVKKSQNLTLENQLYRVEIHQGGTPEKTTIKWSRDNGAVAAKATSIKGHTIVISSAGRDPELGFSPGQLIELRSNAQTLKGEPGHLYRLAQVQGNDLIVNSLPSIKSSDEGWTVESWYLSFEHKTPVTATVKSTDTDNNIIKIELKNPEETFTEGQWVELSKDKEGPKYYYRLKKASENELTIESLPDTKTKDSWIVRRWDSQKDILILGKSTTEEYWIPLENDIQVQFNEKDQKAIYKTGDYWLFAARYLTGKIEWPTDGNNGARFEPPHGIQHHYARLAELKYDGQKWTVVKDLRHKFSPLIGGFVSKKGDTMTGSLTINNTLTVTGKTELADLTVKGNTNLTGSLTVKGETTLNDKLTLAKINQQKPEENVSIQLEVTKEKGLIVSGGLTTLEKGLIVSGGLTTLEKGLTVTGGIKFGAKTNLYPLGSEQKSNIIFGYVKTIKGSDKKEHAHVVVGKEYLNAVIVEINKESKNDENGKLPHGKIYRIKLKKIEITSETIFFVQATQNINNIKPFLINRSVVNNKIFIKPIDTDSGEFTPMDFVIFISLIS